MLSVSLLERTLESRDYDRLLKDLAANGLALPLALRVRLTQSEAAPVALGLRRLVELTYYGPTAVTRRLTAKLLDFQDGSGCFVGDHGPDLLATATALAALSRVAADYAHDKPQNLDGALEQGYAALASLQDCDGLFTAAADRSLADRALTTAFIVGLLGHDDRFRRTARLFDIHRWFEERDGRLDRSVQQLWDLASVSITDALVAPRPLAA